MLFSRSLGLAASMAAVAIAAPVTRSPACKPPGGGDPPTYTLPSTESIDLPNPVNLTLFKIAVGHGLQNYTCANSSATPTAIGALAVLYDVTAAYPGTPGTGLPQDQWDNLTDAAFWRTNLPLNLQDSAAASPGTPAHPNALPEPSYAAVVASPFPASTAPLTIPPQGPAGSSPGSYPFLGRHYFDASGSPTFDLVAANAFLSAAKSGDVKAPADADKGILGTGAVDWLQLHDNGRGLSKTVTYVYRVVTVGGAAQACSVSGAGAGSVPYAAFYWFYAPSS